MRMSKNSLCKIALPAAVSAAAGVTIVIKKHLRKSHISRSQASENENRNAEDKSDVNNKKYYGIDVDAIVGKKADDKCYESLYHDLNKANHHVTCVMALMKHYEENGTMNSREINCINTDLNQIQFILETINIRLRELYGDKYSGDGSPELKQ